MTQPDLANWRPVAITKQAYRRPELLEYGTLREITLKIVGHGMNDGAAQGIDCGVGHMHLICKTAGG